MFEYLTVPSSPRASLRSPSLSERIMLSKGFIRAADRTLRLALACAGLVLAPAARAEDLVAPSAVYPTLPSQAASVEGFVPSGWVLEAKRNIDLNHDGVSDLVFVLHQISRENVVPNPDGLGEKALDTNPRMLVVAFAEPTTGFRRVAVDHTIIPRRLDPVLDDPFDAEVGLSTARDTFSVHLSFFSGAGAWDAISTKLTFRYQSGGFELIGSARDTTNRSSGETTGISANYSTGAMTITTGSISNDAVKVTHRHLRKAKRLQIEQIGDGLAFVPM
jgi:hypothetical protein